MVNELDVCCHTCHRVPGQPCRWGDTPCPMRVRHFASQSRVRTCMVCGPEADRAQVDAFVRFGLLGPDHTAYMQQRKFLEKDGTLTAAGQDLAELRAAAIPISQA